MKKAEFPGAPIAGVVPGSPADDAGFVPGCFVTQVDGCLVRDVIDWRWLSADDAMCVGYVDAGGDAGEVELERDEGQDWGFEFDGVVFDGVKQCRNACTFCFMRQLPKGMRPALSLRDDDFRLSFLSGTFVTLTNLTSADEARILEQCISPLRVSLHAADAQVRRRLMGKHAAHGLAAFDRLLDAGIQAHVQIVLVPDENDGAVLEETLAWAYERPGILDVGIVPLGYTRHQRLFDHSFNDPAVARAVLDTLAPFQERALAERGTPWVFAADEFYRNAFGEHLLDHLPPAEHYGDFSLFEDGIGIVRSYVDDWQAVHASGAARACVQALEAAGVRARYVVGGAMQPLLDGLVAKSPLAGWFAPLTVENTFFGGNVDVTGLLCGCDIADAVVRCVREEARSLELAAARGSGGVHKASSAGAKPSSGRFVRPQDCLSDWALPDPLAGGMEKKGFEKGEERVGDTHQGDFPQKTSYASPQRVESASNTSARTELPTRLDIAEFFPKGTDGLRDLFLVPRVVFNDDGVTLDDMSLKDMERRAGVPLAVVSCNPSEFLPEIEALAARAAHS